MSLLRKSLIVLILIFFVLIVTGCGNESVFDGSRTRSLPSSNSGRGQFA